jgi:hypothetical protein
MIMEIATRHGVFFSGEPEHCKYKDKIAVTGGGSDDYFKVSPPFVKWLEK